MSSLSLLKEPILGSYDQLHGLLGWQPDPNPQQRLCRGLAQAVEQTGHGNCLPEAFQLSLHGEIVPPGKDVHYKVEQNIVLLQGLILSPQSRYLYVEVGAEVTAFTRKMQPRPA